MQQTAAPFGASGRHAAGPSLDALAAMLRQGPCRPRYRPQEIFYAQT
jgi:hypothetical protein